MHEIDNPHFAGKKRDEEINKFVLFLFICKNINGNKAYLLEPQTKDKADSPYGQKRQNPCPSSLRASDMFARVQQLIFVHDNKLRSCTLLAFSGLY